MRTYGAPYSLHQRKETWVKLDHFKANNFLGNRTDLKIWKGSNSQISIVAVELKGCGFGRHAADELLRSMTGLLNYLDV